MSRGYRLGEVPLDVAPNPDPPDEPEHVDCDHGPTEWCVECPDEIPGPDEWVPVTLATYRATDAVLCERARQTAKWGEQDHPDGTGPGRYWPAIFRSPMRQAAACAQAQVDLDATRGESTYAGILTEEVLEALAEDDPAKLRAELVQVAAVAVAWVEAIDRREATP